MGNEKIQRCKRVEDTLLLCEKADRGMHNRLSVLLIELQRIPGINYEILQEIEDLYIHKGIMFVSLAYNRGYEDGSNIKRVNMLTKS